ncbi:MAG: hypothetical protein ABEJ56_04200 [Candidatus Nanohaloarchaea archaeon]
MIRRILEKFGASEPVEIEELESSKEVFRTEKSGEIETVKEKIEEFNEEVGSILEQLESNVDDLEDFEDKKGRDIVDDVVDNIGDNRKRLLKDFEVSGSPDELHSDLESFLEDFRSMSRKEAAVMEEAHLKDFFSDPLGDLEAEKKQIERFLESDYQTLEKYESLKQLIEKRNELENEKAELDDRIDESERHSLEEKLEEMKKELEEVESGDMKKEFRQLEKRLEELESRKEEIHREIGKAMSKMERGLKKLLYEGEISKVSRAGSEILRDIRDGKREELLQKKPEEIEEAVESAKESFTGELLDQNTGEKLKKGADRLKDAGSKMSELEDIESEIRKVEKKIENHEYPEERDRIQKKIDSLEDRLEEEKHKLSELRQRKNQIESEIDSLEDNVVDIFESEFDRKVNTDFN